MRVSSYLLIFTALSTPFANAASLKTGNKILSTELDYALGIQRKLANSVLSIPRSLDDASPELKCLADTGELSGNGDGEYDPFSNLFNDLNSIIGVCDQGENEITCDFNKSDDMAANAKAECDNLGGKIVHDTIIVCSEDLSDEGVEQGEEVPDIVMKNFPLCLAKSCADDTKILDLMKAALELLEDVGGSDADISALESTFKGECSGAGTMGVGSLILAATVGIGAILVL